MDTGTHFVMGIGLYGLTHLDPSVTNNPDMLYAALLGTVIGSQAPDLDTLYRLKGNAIYVRNHRGWTHSSPMIFIWPTIISFIISLFLPVPSFLTLWLWTCLAVFIHIFIDCFNTYGTQALRPFRRDWISLNIINIFDPVIFGLHLIGFVCWYFFRTSEGMIFAIIYLLLISYVAWRTIVHHQVTKWVKQETKLIGKYTVIPTYRLRNWNVIVEMKDRVQMGEIRSGRLVWTGTITTEDKNHLATLKSKECNAVASFLSFTSYGYPQVLTRENGYVVKWLDVRYYHKKQFPFVAVAHLDQNYDIIFSFIGWLSDKQAEKRAENIAK
ncbi:metal-dependent hydrolase [Shimazuella sp. AN120528]|uniref:metal-dependent hydrolase n=1 Tax=Shimazuella soli TaxID=1892854 RepID=UPI001F10743C|nr:metal-dependent hydrolase [Shimazuella soli]MCH5586589.1 metal-dependent hydrolase [Shimazuella soli]